VTRHTRIQISFYQNLRVNGLWLANVVFSFVNQNCDLSRENIPKEYPFEQWMHDLWMDEKQVDKPFKKDTVNGWTDAENIWTAEECLWGRNGLHDKG